MADENDLSDLIRQSAEQPASGSVDGTSATNRSLDELIRAQKHLAQQSSGGAKAIRIHRIKPGGPVL